MTVVKLLARFSDSSWQAQARSRGATRSATPAALTLVRSCQCQFPKTSFPFSVRIHWRNNRDIQRDGFYGTNGRISARERGLGLGRTGFSRSRESQRHQPNEGPEWAYPLGNRFWSIQCRGAIDALVAG